MNGETEEIHQVILAGQRAEIAFETFLQVRNKAVQAYQEVMRMQM
jgi:flagellar hook-basal body complex protein FliE